MGDNSTALATIGTESIAKIQQYVTELAQVADPMSVITYEQFAALYLPENCTLLEAAHAFAATKHRRLDPGRKQVYFVKYKSKNPSKDKLTIITSIDGYRLIADRTGKRGGDIPPQWCGPDGVWKDVWTSAEPPVACKVGVYRSDSPRPFWAVVHYDEYCATQPIWRDGRIDGYEPTGMWKKMPKNQLAKCGEACALRKAHPEELGDLYTQAEMDQAQNLGRVNVRVVPEREQQHGTGHEFVQGHIEPDAPRTPAIDLKTFWEAFHALSRRAGMDRLEADRWIAARFPDITQATREELKALLTELQGMRKPPEPGPASEPVSDIPSEPAKPTKPSKPEKTPEQVERERYQSAFTMACNKVGLDPQLARWWGGQKYDFVADLTGAFRLSLTPLDRISVAINHLREMDRDDVNQIQEDHHIATTETSGEDPGDYDNDESAGPWTGEEAAQAWAEGTLPL